jgi:hypothetical protein
MSTSSASDSAEYTTGGRKPEKQRTTAIRDIAGVNIFRDETIGLRKPEEGLNT